MPNCIDDHYPMIPVRENVAGQIRWACSNPWHPLEPGPCPGCGYSGHPANLGMGPNVEARCRKCQHVWLPS